jgi:hypothetical protein
VSLIQGNKKEEPFNLIQTIPSNEKSNRATVPLIEEVSVSSNERTITNKEEQIKKKKNSHNTKNNQQLDETSFLLPYDALLSLSLFLTHSLFHPNYR